FGIDLNYSLNSRWALQSGVYYSKIGQINNDALNFVQDNDQYLLFAINTSTGNINVAFEKIPDDIRKINPPKDTLESVDIDNVRVVQNFNLLEVPFLIKYNLLNKKLGVSVLGGICPAYVVKNRTYLHVDKEKYDIGNSDNLNTMIYSSTFGIGFNYAISKALLLNFEPVFKYSLSPINKNSQFDYHPYSFSWLTGISYNF
ncbi:MAG: PorT family protein, partial [Bacteroidetes bacterium]|nr:PorT family protein [Bacteroidota bacterium]